MKKAVAKKTVVKHTVVKHTVVKHTVKKAAPVVRAKPKVVVKKRTVHVAAKRPPAFVVPGARREPLAEPPLTVRANALLTWLARHPKATRRERQALALPARVDRRRRPHGVVARSLRAEDPDRRR